MNTNTNISLFPRKILLEQQANLWKDVPSSILLIKEQLELDLWQIFCTSTKRGYCSSKNLTITIPHWAVERGLSYKVWYIAHEFAHALAGAHHMHDLVFMQKLMEICPIHCRHYELTYKPRNAKAAGISLEDSILDSDL